MKFKLEIELGNDAMDSSENLALALAGVSARILQNAYVESMKGETGDWSLVRGIADENGARVGSWMLTPKKED